MDHIRRRQVQNRLLIFRIYSVSLTIHTAVFESPRPLLADHIDLQGFWVGAQGVRKRSPTHDGKRHYDEQRGNRPGYFQAGVAINMACIAGIAGLRRKTTML